MTTTEAEFEATVSEIGPKQEEMTSGITRCIEKFNTTDWGCWANTFSKDNQEKIAAALENLRDMWDEFVREFAKLASPGWPFWFIDSSEDWLKVKELITGQQTFVSDSAAVALPATQTWASSDARVYKAMPGTTNAAMGGAGNNAGSLGDHLHGHGMQLVDLWFRLGMTFIDYVQLAGETVGRFLTADPTKWLDIVNQIIQAVSNIIDFVQELLQLITDQWAQTKEAMYNLDSDFADFSGSVAGAWPTPTNMAE